MKLFKLTLLIVFLLFVIVFIFNYPKLKLISGFAAKNMASCYFLAHQDKHLTEQEDNSSFLIRLAKTEIDKKNKKVTATVFGMSKSTAIYREGVGATLVNDEKTSINTDQPNRSQQKIALPYPHGNLAPVNTFFSNVDYKKIERAVNNCFQENHANEIKNTRSVLVLYKGKILTEEYATHFNKNSLLQGWSMTKSLLTSCFGILEKEAYDIHQPITVFSEWANTDKTKITTNHLLQMESGIQWKEDYGTISDVTNMLFKDEDCTQRALTQKLIAEPGTRFGYASGNSNILSALLRKQFKTHQEYLDFPYKNLIDKIGMHSMILETDVVGNYVCSSYSWATTRDWAKFGQLFLQKGMWNGEQILSKNWVNYISTPNKNSNGEFGGQWWLNYGSFMPNVPKDCFYADGFQGQRIFVVPSKDLVVVRFGITQLSRTESYPLFDKLLGDICHAIQ